MVWPERGMAIPRRAGRLRTQLPNCYYEGYLEKRSFKDKVCRDKSVVMFLFHAFANMDLVHLYYLLWILKNCCVCVKGFYLADWEELCVFVCDLLCWRTFQLNDLDNVWNESGINLQLNMVRQFTVCLFSLHCLQVYLICFWHEFLSHYSLDYRTICPLQSHNNFCICFGFVLVGSNLLNSEQSGSSFG